MIELRKNKELLDKANRLGTKAEKWDGMDRKYFRDDLLPLWIADMDFKVAKPISDAIVKRAEHEVYGYGICDDDYYDALINWMERKHNWKLEKDWILYTNGVISAISFAIDAITEPGDRIMIQTPVYDPFYTIIEDNDCEVVENPLIYEDGEYSIDFNDFEEKAKSGVKIFLLCSPHNPIGRVWTKEELTKLTDICLENNITIISDEIHSEIIFKENRHTNLATISKEVENNSIICTSPTKAFNIAGLQVANIIVKNEDIREKIEHVIEKNHFIRPSIFGVEGLIAAYNYSEDWLEETTEYIEENKKYFINYVDKHIDGIHVVDSEGTYLLWIDFSGLDLTNKELNKFLQEDCGLATIDGKLFGKQGEQFQRFNIACDRELIKEALYRLEYGVNKRLKA